MAYDYPKYGHPRSEAERRQRHRRLHGKGKLPPRGTGKSTGSPVADAIAKKMG